VSTRVQTVVNERYIARMRRNHEEALREAGQLFLDTARVPDAPPYGQGLVDTGFADVERSRDGARLEMGFGFPSRFLEKGTIKMRAQPFITPAAEDTVPQIPGIIRRKHRRM